LKTALYRIEVGTRSVPLSFVRHRKARRYILRMLPEGQARVTIPRGGTVEHAVEFVRKNTPWLQRQLQRTPPRWENGTEILFRGVARSIQITPGERGFQVAFAGLQFEASAESEIRPQLEARLRTIATQELAARTFELAGRHGLEVRAVRVGNQRSRWGSCSTRKTICLNWRLIQTPEFVRDYIILHELMHLREMNHSAKFWAHVAEVCPGYVEAERWLKKAAGLLR
jgi:predicted metal-dependent hydrolase